MFKTGAQSFFGSSFFIFMVRFFPLVANILVIIVFSRLLDKSDYGGYQNFWVQLYLLNPIACAGIHVLILTYAPVQIVSLIKRIRGTHYLAFAGWLLFISVIFAFFRHQATGIPWFIPLLFLLSYSLSLIIESFLIAFKRFGLLVSVSIFYALAYGFMHWLFLQGRLSVDNLFAGIAIIIMVKVSIYSVFAKLSIKAQNPDISADLSFDGMRSLWLHLGLYDISQMVFRWLDKFIISVLLTEQLSAIYFNGSIDIPFLSVILGAVGSAALIQMAGNKANSNEGAIFISNYSSRLLSAVVFPLFFFFLFFSEELFRALLSEKYLPSVPIFVVSIFTMPLYAYHLTAILQNKHKGAIINKGTVLDLVIALSLMYPFYQLLGLPGVALSIVVSSYVQAGFYLYHTGRALEVSVLKLLPLGNWLTKIIVFFLLFITIHYLLELYCSEQIVLFLGGGIAAAIVIVSLAIELRLSKRKYGDALSRT